ncbi:hypothetical protein [Agrobacterium tumefaciens]|jgi:hypothetical protein|uniref:hypothetical protein n=1 Tax=Agrobacterium tumefaciens TaxID=358 RepID=UPI00165927F0|nr:hypothetical protein [Agrobacterium tumefaciens]QNP81956.1 hypothetical protein IAI05_18525 [Agrobacterium tumefaciens]
MKAIIVVVASAISAVGAVLACFAFFNTVGGSLDFVRVSRAFVGLQSMGGIDPQAQELAGTIAFQCNAAQTEVMRTAAQQAAVDLTIDRVNLTQSLTVDAVLTSVSALASQSDATPEQFKCLAALTLMKIKFPAEWSYAEREHPEDLEPFVELLKQQQS